MFNVGRVINQQHIKFSMINIGCMQTVWSAQFDTITCLTLTVGNYKVTLDHISNQCLHVQLFIDRSDVKSASKHSQVNAIPLSTRVT